jgi:hypothetical protein
MERVQAILTSPPVLAGLVAALIWAPATGFPTWPALARGRCGSTFGVSLAVGLFVFAAVQGLTAPMAG